MLLVNQLMVPKPTTVQVGSTLGDALLIMRTQGIRHLPILDGDRLVGIVSDRDVLHWITPRIGTDEESEIDLDPLGFMVEEVMTPNPVTVLETDLVSHAADIMIDQRFGALPVVSKSGVLQGIISTVDCMMELVRRLRAEEAPRRKYA
jgi:acetoin utilization protein AcuB